MSTWRQKFLRRQRVSALSRYSRQSSAVVEQESDFTSSTSHCTNDNDKDVELSAYSSTQSINLTSLILLSISSAVGSGIYVLTGIASSNDYAGPFAFVSYLIAGLVCLFSAFSYAEFSCRIKDKTGSSYSFVYNSIGEIFAFVIGWYMLLSSIAGISASSITCSQYFDALFNHTISDFIANKLHLSWHLSQPFSNHLDLVAIGMLVSLTIVSLFGVKLTIAFNNCLALLNISILTLVCIAGVFYGDTNNLTSSISTYKNGVNGVIKGVSVVMYAYFGFESSTYAVSIAKNPSRNLPIALIVSIIVIDLIYSGATLSINLIQPISQIDGQATFPSAFKNIKWMQMVVSIGPVISLLGAQLVGIYFLGQITYSLANDGLLFKFLSRIHPVTKIPNVAIIFTVLLCLTLVAAIDVKDMIGFADIVGFLTYSVISAALLVVRYCGDDDGNVSVAQTTRRAINFGANENDEEENLLESSFNGENNNGSEIKLTLLVRTKRAICKRNPFNSNKNALSLIVFNFFVNILLGGLVNISFLKTFQLAFIVLILFFNVLTIILLSFFKQTGDSANVTFKIPFVPILPIIVIGVNIYLMMACEFQDWMIFFILLVPGLAIYLVYGVRNSKVLCAVSL